VIAKAEAIVYLFKSATYFQVAFSFQVVVFAAFIEPAPTGGDGRLVAIGQNLLLVQVGVLESHIHEDLADSRITADLGVGGMIECLDVLLKGGTQRVDVLIIQLG